MHVLLPVICAIGVLGIALATPRGFITSIGYIPLVLCGLGYRQPKITLILAAIASVLSLFAFAVEPHGPFKPRLELAHEAMLLGTIWLMALVVVAQRRSVLRFDTAQKLAGERFEKIVEFSPYPIVVLDTVGSIVLTNRQAETLFGYTRAELLGKNVERLIPERFRARHPEHRGRYFASLAQQGQEIRPMGQGAELFCLRKDGTEVPVEISLIPIQTATAPFVYCTIVDISARLAAEAQTRNYQEDLQRQVAERTAQLAASNRELEQFAYAASHDLKAPLRVIENAANWLMEDLQDQLSDDTRETMDLLRSHVKRMNKLLDDLLEYARISATGQSGNIETLPGDALVQDILTLLAPGDRFTVTLDGPFSEVTLRRMPLQQVLMNLIGNAIKHHHKPAGAITLSLRDEGPFWRFTVADDGPGIPKRLQKKAFEMFQTLKPRDQVEGSGMGLAIVRKHVESAGGALTLDSEENAGCRFIFTWPK